MRKLSFLILILLSPFFLKSQYSLTDNDIKEYEEQVRQMVNYLQETLNFIGDPSVSAQEKDVIFKESYIKIFRDDKVQIEDDLDENRGVSIHKDVQAYLKDVDFFYDNVKFKFDIQSITPQINDSGETFFKVSMIRSLAGWNIVGDTINNNRNRYLEINLDIKNKDLKIVSFYTTKPNEKVELCNWWNSMDKPWKEYLGKDYIVYDSIKMSDINMILKDGFEMPVKEHVILKDSFMIVDNDTMSMDRADELYGHKPDTVIFINDVVSRWVNKTITADLAPIYETLKLITKTTNVDVSNNQDIKNINPLSELPDLQSLDCSNTKVSDISPIRNHNKITELNISNTQVKDISNLKYANVVQNFTADNLNIDDISIVAFFEDMTNFSIANTKVTNIAPIAGCINLISLNLSNTNIDNITDLKELHKLCELDISGNNISDIEPLSTLVNLNSLNIDSICISDLSPLKNLTKLKTINCSNTKVASLDPLKDMVHLHRVYCDNTLITKEMADDFMRLKSNVIVIAETKMFEVWWKSLPSFWKSLLSSQNNTNINPTKEELHVIINMKSLKLNDVIQDIAPIEYLTNLENLDLSNSKIDDISPLRALRGLKTLDISNTEISDLSPLSKNEALRFINMEKTKVSSLKPLHGLTNITKILAEDSEVTAAEVYELKKRQRQVTVIYQTDNLRLWWGNLSSSWKDIFNSYVKCNINPTAEQLQSIVDLEEIEIDNSSAIHTLEPLTQLMFLRKLVADNNQIYDLSPLEDKIYLEVLSVSGNPIDNIAPLQNLNALREIDLENTTVSDLVFISYLQNVKILNISGTYVKNLKPLAEFNALEELMIANTSVKNIYYIENLPSLKYLEAFKTKIKSKYIELLRINRPDIQVKYN